MVKRLTKGRALALALIVSLLFAGFLGTLAVGSASAQETTTSTPTTTPTKTATSTASGETPASTGSNTADAEGNETAEQVLFDFGDGVELVNVDWSYSGEGDGRVKIRVRADDSTAVTITDSGAVQSLGSNEGTEVTYNTYFIDEGMKTIVFQVQGEELITIQSEGRMYASAGERSVIEILNGAPTTALLQWSAISGGVGGLMALGLVVGYRRRKHENTYRELFSEERVRVEEDTVDGVLGKVQRFVRHHQYALLLAAAVVGYATLVVAGVLPSPGAVWDGLTDAQRVLVVGSSTMTVLLFVPVYVLSSRLWEPSKEFIVAFDVRDSLSVSAGSKGGIEEFLEEARDDDGEIDIEELVNGDDQIAISIYSGSPKRISKLNVVDGELNDLRSPGGRTYLARDFNPKKNVATGTWPGTAHDVIIAIAFAAIEWNREVMEDESAGFRELVAGMGPIRSGANSSAAVALNKELAESTDIDPGPTNNMLDRALASTRYGGYFTDDEDEDESDESNGEDKDEEEGNVDKIADAVADRIRGGDDE